MIEKLPKVLLHTHLEGSIPSTILHELSRRNRITLPFQMESDALLGTCRINGWKGFLSAFYAINSCFRTRHDFSDSIVGYGEKLARENVLHAEIHCTPWNHLSRGVSLDEISEGLFSGIEIVKGKLGISLRIIVDLVRDPSENVPFIMSWLQDLPKSHFVALGVSGGPESVPLENFRPVFHKARDIGLGLVAHAGELEGPRSIIIALKDLNVNRICHGVRALEDDTVLNQAKSAGIHFELCPTSNKILGIGQDGYISIASMLNSGANCSVNTDDELLFGTTLTKELNILWQNKISTWTGILDLQENAAQAAFIESSERMAILSRLSIFRQNTALSKDRELSREVTFGESHDLS